MSIVCNVCGSTDFSRNKVLWPGLVAEWGLLPAEVDYVDRQQGTYCLSCGTQIRGMALTASIQAWMSETRPLKLVVADSRYSGLRVLDMNGCGGVSEVLSVMPGYVRADYPEFDMQSLPFADGSYDLIFHSDTLEHIPDPLKALRECLRLLKPGGQLCFTAPTIVGRMSRNRAGLPDSFHGAPGANASDFLVHSEFGADLWCLLAEAGASHIQIHTVDYPAGIAMSAGRARVATSAVAIDEPKVMNISADHVYHQDNLMTSHNHEFMNDDTFLKAYARGVKAAEVDYNWHWRVHVGLWAARVASKLSGDYVECGVNKGFLSSAIMEMLDWDTTNRKFYLLDTFSGIDPRYISAVEAEEGILEKNAKTIESGFYVTSVDAVMANFSQWKNKKIIVGSIPDTLSEIDTNQVAFLHIDMNCVPPEVAAIEYLWNSLVPGAVVLLDDYAYIGYRQQKLGMDEFAQRHGVQVLSLPTGQGLIIKPPMGEAVGTVRPRRKRTLTSRIKLFKKIKKFFKG